MQNGTDNSSAVDSGTGLPLVIVNPKSAGGSTQTRWSEIASDLRSHFGPYTVALTKRPGDGTDIAERFIASGRRFIIACGGDGTINEVANGVIRSGEDVTMGIVPAGTGGDLRRSLGISSTPREAARQLRVGVTREVDAGKVAFTDFEGRPAERYFLNVASFGLSASINDRVKKKGSFAWIPSETVRGKTKFALSTLQEVFDPEFKIVNVAIDGEPATRLATLNFCICNARFFGGGMQIAPDAKLDDGLLDLVNIGDLTTLRILLNSYKLYSGTHLALPEVKSRLVKRIEASTADPSEFIDFETDGEIPGRLPAVFEIVAKAIKLRVPAPERH
ncbi:MAG TPA: diacylglycerol kinase family protein [Aridibacter sp.]|nr:diacylglycerol kinase family protein [Aridibacter sp.]